jgi:hypothetical protein
VFLFALIDRLPTCPTSCQAVLALLRWDTALSSVAYAQKLHVQTPGAGAGGISSAITGWSPLSRLLDLELRTVSFHNEPQGVAIETTAPPGAGLGRASLRVGWVTCLVSTAWNLPCGVIHTRLICTNVLCFGIMRETLLFLSRIYKMYFYAFLFSVSSPANYPLAWFFCSSHPRDFSILTL